MSLVQRISLIACALLAALVCFVVYGSATREAKTQTEGAAAEQPSFQAPDDAQFARGEIIVKLEDDATQAELAALNRRNDASTEEDLPFSKVNVVDLPGDLSVREAVETYEDSPDVEYAEPNFKLEPTRTPNDTHYARYMYGLNNTGQTGGVPDADIDAPEAWESTTGLETTVVAVIDTGVNYVHPDLSGNLWTNLDEIPDDGKDNDGNSYVDDYRGWDFYHDDETVYDSATYDDHGTHVAGTIAAQGNDSTGVTGVAWDAQIMSLKFIGPEFGYTSDAVEAINYAVKNGAPISNNSWGGGGYSQSLKDAIARADSRGHLFVAAAGNDGTNNDATPHYPSSYTDSNIIAVAATNDGDGLASFSNYGVDSVDLAAPGVNILSTVPGGYGWYSGTSMATPHVAGTAALLESQNPLLTDGDLKARILEYAEPKNTLDGKVATGGRLNAFASLTQTAPPAAQPAPPPSDSTRPAVTNVRPYRSTRDRTPRITAVVRDDRSELSQSDIRFRLDRRLKSFNYYPSTDQFIHQSRRLSYGRHTAQITATDDAGNSYTRTWRFKVIKRR